MPPSPPLTGAVTRIPEGRLQAACVALLSPVAGNAAGVGWDPQGVWAWLWGQVETLQMPGATGGGRLRPRGLVCAGAGGIWSDVQEVLLKRGYSSCLRRAWTSPSSLGGSGLLPSLEGSPWLWALCSARLPPCQGSFQDPRAATERAA